MISLSKCIYCLEDIHTRNDGTCILTIGSTHMFRSLIQLGESEFYFWKGSFNKGSPLHMATPESLRLTFFQEECGTWIVKENLL